VFVGLGPRGGLMLGVNTPRLGDSPLPSNLGRLVLPDLGRERALGIGAGFVRSGCHHREVALARPAGTARSLARPEAESAERPTRG
jgi:hypothetical protein